MQLALVFCLTLRNVHNITMPIATPISAPLRIINYARIPTRICIRTYALCICTLP